MRAPLRHTLKHLFCMLGIVVLCVSSGITAEARSGGSASGGSASSSSSSSTPTPSYSPSSSGGSYTSPSYGSSNDYQPDYEPHGPPRGNYDSNPVAEGIFMAVSIILRVIIALAIGIVILCGIVYVFDRLKAKITPKDLEIPPTTDTAQPAPAMSAPPSEQSAPPPRGDTHTLLLEVSMSDGKRTIQHTIEQLTTDATLDTPAGRHAYISELLLVLRRRSHAMSHARSDTNSMSAEEADSYLNQVAHDARAKFERDIIRKTESKESRATQRNVTSPDALLDEDGDFDVHECIVLTLALAHNGDWIDDVPDASPRDTYKAHIRQLAGLTSTQLLRIEVIWSPSAESDAMSKLDMITNYPELVDIT